MSGSARRARAAVFASLAAAAAARRVEVVRDQVAQLSLAALLPQAALGLIVAIALRFALMSQRRRRRQVAANGGDEVTLDLPWESGLSQLSDALTINGSTVEPTFLYNAADATAASWPGRYGPTLAIAGSGAEPTLDAGSPLLGAEDTSVVGAGGKYFAKTSAITIARGVTDYVIEAVVRLHGSPGNGGLLTMTAFPQAGGQLYYNSSTNLYWYEYSSGSAVGITLVTGAALGSWYHLMVLVDATGNMSAYVNGTHTGTVSVGAVGTTEYNLPIYAGLANESAVSHWGFWQGENWLDTSAQATLAKQRFHALTGVKAATAKDDLYPETCTRTTTAILDKVESDGTRKGYLAGPNWPRVVTRKDNLGATIQGYLSEPQATNQCLDRDMGGANWNTGPGVTLSAGSDVSPLGGTMYDVTEDATASARQMYSLAALNSPSATIAISIFAKAKGSGRYLLIHSQHSPIARATFDLVNGAVTDEVAGTAHIEDWGNGVYRCILIRPATVQITSVYVCPRITSASTVNDTFAGRSEVTACLSEPQFENASSYPSSYISTAGAAATRTKDVLKYSATGHYSARGTLAVQTYAEDYDATAGGAFVELSNDTTTERILLYQLVAAEAPAAYCNTAGGAAGGPILPSGADVFDGAIHDLSLSWGGGKLSYLVDALVASDTSADAPSAADVITVLRLGCYVGGDNFQPSATIGRLTIRR